MKNISLPIETLQDWQRQLENDPAKKAAFAVAESIYDTLAEHERLSKEKQPAPNLTLGKPDLGFNQITIGQQLRVRKDKGIKPLDIQGLIVTVIEKKRTNVIIHLEQGSGTYKAGHRFNIKPHLLETTI